MPQPMLTPHAIRDMVDRLNRGDFPRWSARTRATGGCAQPIHLRGRVDYRDPLTGRLLHRYSTNAEPGGVLRVACKTRRASRCPACAEIYRADTYQLVRAGLAGGKGVPDTVTAHPAAFLTLTAPSFGSVHTRRHTAAGVQPCHPRRDAQPCPHGRLPSCTARHAADDPVLGEPLCPDCYDYTGSVLFNAFAPELWRRFILALRRHLAKSHGLRVAGLRDVLTVSFAKVAEYQRRGVVHFHAVIRLDGPGGPHAAPPRWADYQALSAAVTHAAAAVSVGVAAVPGHLAAQTFAWGAQVDIRPIAAAGDLTDQAVAGYIAKYATKAAECTGTLDRRVRPGDDLDDLPVSPHAKRLIAECRRLGELDDLADLRLTEWAHMLGFRGHFSTKSRRYSTTLGALRAARASHNQEAHTISTGRLPFDDDQILVIADWHYVGQGLSPGELLLTAALTGQPLPPLDPALPPTGPPPRNPEGSVPGEAA